METKDKKLLEQGNPILQVAIELGIKIRSNMGICFQSESHMEGSDEFTLFFNLADNSYFCKVCPNIGGNVIDLVCQRQGWERQKAIDWLIHRIDFDLETKDKYYRKDKKRRKQTV
jgi:hypothetical protein